MTEKLFFCRWEIDSLQMSHNEHTYKHTHTNPLTSKDTHTHKFIKKAHIYLKYKLTKEYKGIQTIKHVPLPCLLLY